MRTNYPYCTLVANIWHLQSSSSLFLKNPVSTNPQVFSFCSYFTAGNFSHSPFEDLRSCLLMLYLYNIRKVFPLFLCPVCEVDYDLVSELFVDLFKRQALCLMEPVSHCSEGMWFL